MTTYSFLIEQRLSVVQSVAHFFYRLRCEACILGLEQCKTEFWNNLKNLYLKNNKINFKLFCNRLNLNTGSGINCVKTQLIVCNHVIC